MLSISAATTDHAGAKASLVTHATCMLGGRWIYVQHSCMDTVSRVAKILWKYHVCNALSIRRSGFNCTVYFKQAAKEQYESRGA